jgi:hypothetical protein
LALRLPFFCNARLSLNSRPSVAFQAALPRKRLLDVTAGRLRPRQSTAAALEDDVDHLWVELCRGQASVASLQRALAHKVRLAAIGVDALLPPAAQVEEWLAASVPATLLADIVEGCYQPTSGYVAYDVLEFENWILAAALLAHGHLSAEARARFIQHGLFFIYDTLDNAKKEYFFGHYPLETALRYSRSVGGSSAIEAHLEEIRQRGWRRRYHREWARQQLDGVTDPRQRQRLLVLQRFIGSARDFDEEKRRLNMKLWRCLFALADGLMILLSSAGTVPACLYDAIRRCGGKVTIDPAFFAKPPRLIPGIVHVQ